MQANLQEGEVQNMLYMIFRGFYFSFISNRITRNEDSRSGFKLINIEEYYFYLLIEDFPLFYCLHLLLSDFFGHSSEDDL